jgi:hypothetical protein
MFENILSGSPGRAENFTSSSENRFRLKLQTCIFRERCPTYAVILIFENLLENILIRFSQVQIIIINIKSRTTMYTTTYCLPICIH